MSYSFHSSRCLHPHHSPVRHGAYLAVLFIVVLTVISTSHCSTIGVEYVSRLPEIQNRERAPAVVQVAAARGVLERFLPSHSASFEFRIVSKVQSKISQCLSPKYENSGRIEDLKQKCLNGSSVDRLGIIP